METPVLDAFDHIILGELRRQGRMSWRELGQTIGLGPTSTADRVRRLESIGVIRGYGAEVDLSALGMGLRAITEIRLNRRASVPRFEEELARAPEVQTAMHVTGAMDYVLLLACEDVPALDRLLTHWRTNVGVEESSSRIILREVELVA
ncbi:MAG: Lrp/AsnC family transcriptional regulator [Acidimicrobiales bacterium]